MKALGAPVELEGEGIGTRRTIKFGSKAPVVERLDALDHGTPRASRTRSWRRGRCPCANYQATMQLAPSGESATTLTWFSDFEPEGVSEEDAIKAVKGVYDGGIAGLQRHFAG